MNAGAGAASSCNGAPATSDGMDDRVFAVGLTPSGCDIRLAHSHSTVEEVQWHDCWAGSHASVEPDLARTALSRD